MGELPFAGHPSLGTAVAVAHARGEREAHYVQQTGAGLQAVDVELGRSGVARASMLQEPAVFGDEIDPARVFAALGPRRRPTRTPSCRRRSSRPGWPS